MMATSPVPESDLTQITERIIRVTPPDPKDNSRFLAARWLNRLFYDVRRWNLGFIQYLRTYPGFRKSRSPADYHQFFQGLAKYRASLDDRYGEAKGDLCANLKMLHARFSLDFRWLYDSDPKEYDFLYELVRKAYQNEDSILETAQNVVYDVIAKESVRYASNVERELDQTEFVMWHVKNHLSVVQTILDYENRSGEAVKELNLLADKAGFRLLSLAEYERGLSDPFKHPETMIMGDIMERTTSTSNLPSHQSARLKTVLAFSFGVVFLGLILALVVFIPHPTPVQYHFFTVTIALAAGGLAAVMAGIIDVRVGFGKSLTIGAAGTLGVLVVVYFFLPAMVSNP